jgi:hypothetical protein
MANYQQKLADALRSNDPGAWGQIRNMAANAISSGNNPLESQYGPVDAGLIAAGRSMSNAVDQTKAGYYTAQRNMSDALNNPAAVNSYQASLDELNSNRANETQSYNPLTVAYPYTTAIGESLPAIAGGVGALKSVSAQNVTRRGLQEMQRAVPDEMPHAETIRSILERLINHW